MTLVWRSPLLAVAVTACAITSACNCRDCGSGPPPVPFKADGSTTAQPSTEPDDDDDAGPDAGPAASAFRVIDATAPAPGARSVALGATQVTSSGDVVLLWLAAAADADGSRALAALARRASGEVYLAGGVAAPSATSVSLRPVARASFTPTPGCGLTTSLRQIAEASIVASLQESCGVAADAGATTGATTHAPEWWIARLGAEPRLHERLVVGNPVEPEDPVLSVSTEPVDADADGRGDVSLRIALSVAGARAEARLVFVDRPAGLAREPSEPEASVASLAGAARRRLRRQPEPALASASAALALHHAICRESGRARIQLAGAEGVTCGRSRGAATAAAVRTAGLARAGRIAEALDAAADLDADWARPSDATRAIATEALSSSGGNASAVWLVQGPLHPTVGDFALRARLPLLAFTDNDHIALRGPIGSLYSLTDGSISDAQATAPLALAIVDTSGTRAVVDVHRTCAGTVIGLASAIEAAGGSPPRNAPGPLLEQRAAPGAAGCNGPLPAALASDDHGWLVVGWAPSGIVAVRGAHARVVPVNVEGQPAGPPYDVDSGTPLPAPLPAGAALPDGSGLAYVTAFGPVVRRFGSGASVRLLRPSSGWTASLAEHASDVTLSPDASRVAWISGGRVVVVGTGAPPGAATAPAP